MNNQQFDDVFFELQQMVKELEEKRCPKDEDLGLNIRKAKLLISFCEDKLKEIESETLKKLPIV